MLRVRQLPAPQDGGQRHVAEWTPRLLPRKDKGTRPRLVHLYQDCHSGVGKRHAVLYLSLGAVLWQRPKRIRHIDFVPRCISDFA